MDTKAVKSTLQDDSLAFAVRAVWSHELPLLVKVHAILTLAQHFETSINDI